MLCGASRNSSVSFIGVCYVAIGRFYLAFIVSAAFHVGAGGILDEQTYHEKALCLGQARVMPECLAMMDVTSAAS